jgi:aspartyl/asparaginyl beta-hydroxylase (cupin superfamily)
MTIGTKDAAPAMWRNSGTPLVAEPGRPLILRIGKHLRGLFDRMIAASSLVANDPVLDMRHFGWTALLRDQWHTIRDEAAAVALQGQPAPSLATISPDHRAIAEVDKWRSFFLWGYGYPIEDNLARCPATQALVARIPGLNSAFFSILAPGTHIPAHRGVTKGLITCHLGLFVPRDGDVRMRVGDRIVRWAEGETTRCGTTAPARAWSCWSSSPGRCAIPASGSRTCSSASCAARPSCRRRAPTSAPGTPR